MASFHVGSHEADESSPLIVRVQTESHEKMSSEVFWKLGSLFGAAAVALAAFGAHGLKNYVPDQDQRANFALAAHYQLIHAGVLLVARGHTVAASLFTLGITLFSGSIYALVLGGQRFKVIGPVTPIGGLCLVVGWLALFFTRGPRYRSFNVAGT